MVKDATHEAVPILRADYEALIEALQKAKAGINAMLIMADIAKPQKLDETLCWIHNDDLAKSLASDALARIDAVLAKVAPP